MKYDVEADWFLLTSCNFRCPYCLLPASAVRARINVYGTPEQWAAAFDATGKTWLLHMSGGEPSLYPEFVELCKKLSERHYLSINSNLSRDSMNALAEVIDPARVHYVNASMHYDEMKKKGSLDGFVERVFKLQERRFTVFPSVVMTPDTVRRFPDVFEEFESQGLYLIPKTMRGKYEGRKYPGGYSEKEKRLIIQYSEQALPHYQPVLERMGEPPTTNVLNDRHFLEGKTRYRGKLCGSGYNFVVIYPRGRVIRCGSKERLGNILSGDVTFLAEPKRCDTKYCPYFCEKYTSPRFVPHHPNKATFFRKSLSRLFRM